ncbi:MAG: polyprenyl synthetase family protein [Planctomycetes bacterium]|nr:polyprenyl synthetase family protein [Planctomycetota bacterium]
MIVAAPSITATLTVWSQEFDRRICERFDAVAGAPPELLQAMRHTVLAPGKRLRPFLTDRCFRLAGGDGDAILPVCIAVECLHAFTLIHDDLPAIDDGDMRRGRPCNHKVFGEGLAILAGDALLAYGLELASGAELSAARTVRIVQTLTRAIGPSGVIGGETTDIISEERPGDLKLASYIHEHKTAGLFRACCECGAIAAAADERVFNNLGAYGFHLGLAFQIADDLLDATASSEDTGKTSGGDAEKRKQSYPAIVGLEESHQLGEQAVARAVAALDDFGTEADELRSTAQFVMSRQR